MLSVHVSLTRIAGHQSTCIRPTTGASSNTDGIYQSSFNPSNERGLVPSTTRELHCVVVGRSFPSNPLVEGFKVGRHRQSAAGYGRLGRCEHSISLGVAQPSEIPGRVVLGLHDPFTEGRIMCRFFTYETSTAFRTYHTVGYPPRADLFKRRSHREAVPCAPSSLPPWSPTLHSLPRLDLGRRVVFRLPTTVWHRLEIALVATVDHTLLYPPTPFPFRLNLGRRKAIRLPTKVLPWSSTTLREASDRCLVNSATGVLKGMFQLFPSLSRTPPNAQQCHR